VSVMAAGVLAATRAVVRWPAVAFAAEASCLAVTTKYAPIATPTAAAASAGRIIMRTSPRGDGCREIAVVPIQFSPTGGWMRPVARVSWNHD
jgi:hypothetical protein